MNWLSWQIDYLLLLQNFRNLTQGCFDNFFLFISQIGVSPFTLIIICSIYWCISKKLGIYMIYCSCFSYLMNIFLKFTFCIYRPWLIDSRIEPIQEAFETAPGYSFPSGHTSGAVSFWGSIAMYFREKKWVVYPCILIIFLVMLSRNYLGVHTSQDVIVSFLVGIAILIFVRKLFNWMQAKSGRDNILMVAITIICIILGIYLTFKSYPIDYKDGLLVYDVTDEKTSAIARIANVCSILLGCFLELKFIKFEPVKGSIIKKIIIAVVGILIIFLFEIQIRNVLNAIMDNQTSKFIIRILTGFFVTFIYPYFINLLNKKYQKNNAILY